jgi:hypothetical protein
MIIQNICGFEIAFFSGQSFFGEPNQFCQMLHIYTMIAGRILKGEANDASLTFFVYKFI